MYSCGALMCTASLFSSGALLQTFLANHGVSGDLIGTLTATMSMTQTITILLLSTFVDRMRDAIKAGAVAVAFLPLFYLVMLPFTFLTDVPAVILFTAAMIAGVIQFIFHGLYVVLLYRIPYQVIDMKQYGRISSIDGMVSGITMVLVSTLTTYLISVFPFDRVMSFMFAIAALCVAGASFLISRYKPIAQPFKSSQANAPGLLRVLKLPAFRILLIPNLMRGFNSGIVGMMTTIAIHELTLTASQSSAMAIVITAMSIIGAFNFLKLSARIRLHHLYLIASVIVLIAMPLLMAVPSFPVFLIFFIVLLIGTGLADYTVPVLIAEIIPYECIGSYTSLRMGTHTGGVALGSMVAGLALSSFPVALLLLLSGCLQFSSGLVYFLFCRKQRPIANG